MTNKKTQPSESYLIEKEKQKTARSKNRFLFFGIIIIGALIALYFIVGKGGKGGIDVDIVKGTFKFNVDKPVVEQAKTETKTYKSPDGKNINYTTGKINKTVVKDFSTKDISFSPYSFNGENYVNEEAGYIISSAYPDSWKVFYDPDALHYSDAVINTFMAPDGISHLNITREQVSYDYIEDFIDAAVNDLIYSGFIEEYPYVSYADDGLTAFLTFTNQSYNDQSYMKVVEGFSYYYIATANYNLDYSDPGTVDELIWMVANFTLFE